MKNERLSKTRGLFLVLTAVISAFAFAGCIESDPPMIEVSKHSIQTGCEAQSISVTVTSNARWTAASNSSWVTLSRTEGTDTEELDLILDACDASQSRMAVVTLKTEGRNETQTTITVSQSAKNAVLQISPAAVTAGAAAQDVAFAIASNGDWTVTSSSDWATPKSTSGSGNAIVKIALAENSSHISDREAKIVVSAGNDVERTQAGFTITQLSRELPSLFLTHSTLSFTADAKTAGTNVASVPIITNITGDVKVTSEFSWCDATYSNGVVTVTVQDNAANEPRTCIVTVYADVAGTMVMKQILVSQAGLGAPTLTMVNTNIVLPSFSGDPNDMAQAVSVFYLPSSDGIAVSVENDYPEWISGVAVDMANNMVSFNVSANESSSSRTAELSVIAKIGDRTMAYPVSVTQQGVGEVKVVLSRTGVAIPAEGSSVTVDAFVNTPQATISAYSANASWVTVNSNSSSNSFGISSTVAITCAENTSAGSRSAEVLVPVKVGDQMAYGAISVVQAGVGAPDASVTESSVKFVKAGGSYAVNIYGADAKTTIKTVIPVSWLKAVATNEEVTFTAEPNASSASRSTAANLIFTRGGETEIIPIDVTQSGTGSAELLIAQSSYVFTQVGATYEIPIESENGTTYEVIGTPDWIATETMTMPDGIRAVVASNPDANERKGDIVILANNGDDYVYYIIGIVQKGLEAPDIALGQTEIVIPRTATVGTEGFAVTVSGADASTAVTAKSDQPWVKGIISTDKTSISIAAQENKASDKRTANISVVAERGGEEEVLSFAVVQPGTGSADLRIAVTDYTFGPKEIGEFDIPVTALNGTSYSVASKPDFVTVTGDGSAMLKLALTSNEATTESRSGVIVLRAVNGSDETQYSIRIKQFGVNGPNVQASIYSIVVPRTAITGNEGYDVALVGADAATSLRTASTATWVEGVITAGRYLSFRTEENTASDARSAVVSVIAERGGEEQVLSVKVTQPGTGSAELEIALPDYTFTYEKVDSFPIPVTMLHGTQYTVAAKPEWLDIDGEGTNTLMFSLPKNTVVEKRSGTVVLRATNGDDETEYTIGITQLGIDGPDIITEFREITVPRMASDNNFLETLGYDGDTKVTFIPNATWFTAGWNDRKDRIYFNVQENTLSAKRQATLTVQAEKGGQQQQFVITVIQPGTGSAELEIPHKVYYFTYKDTTGFKIPVNALNGSEWTVSSENGNDEDWLSWDGEGTEDFTVNLAKNNLVDQRSETLVFRATNGDDETLYDVEIIQLGIDGPNVTALHESITIPYWGVSYWPVLLYGVDSDTQVEIEENCLWASAEYSPYSDSGFIISAEDNIGNESRSFTVSILATKGGQTQIIYVDVTQLGVGSPYLVLSSQDIVVPADEGTFNFNFFSPFPATNSVTASVLGTDDFLTVSNPEVLDASPQYVFYRTLLHFTSNETTADRVEEFVLTASSGSESVMYTIKVTQLGNKAPKVYAVNANRTVGAGGGTDDVMILNANGAVPGAASASEDWITSCSASSGAISYTCAANTSNTPRMAVVSAVYVLNGESRLMQVFVTQLGNGGAILTLSGNEYTFGHEAVAAFPVGVIKEASTTTYVLSSASDWITDFSQDADGLTFDVAENTAASQRQGYITVVATNGAEQSVYTIGVVQMGTEGPDVTAIENSLELPSNAVTSMDNKIDLAGVDAETSVWAYDNVSWLKATYDPAGKFVYVNTETNTLDQPRTATISIVATKNDQIQCIRISVVQDAAKDYSFSINPNTLYFDKNGGARVITASYTNIRYLVTDPAIPNWITFHDPGVMSDGVYYLDIAAAAQAGPADPAREFAITIRYGASATDYRTMTINVSQASSSDYYLEPGGGVVLLPACVTSPVSLSGERRIGTTDGKMVTRSIEIHGANSLSGLASNVAWADPSTSDNSAVISGLANNTFPLRRYGFIDFNAQPAGTPLQIQVVQLSGEDPQIVGGVVESSDDFIEKMSVNLLSTTNTVTYNTLNVTDVTALKTDWFEGYNTLAPGKYSVTAVYADNKITLTVEPASPLLESISQGSVGIVRLDVTNGTDTNTYFVKVLVPNDIHSVID